MTNENLLTNAILEMNGGLHDPRRYKAAIRMIRRCSKEYKAARMYHIVLHNSNKYTYKAAWEDTCRELTKRGISYRWKSALETDSDDQHYPGVHMHVFIIVEAEYTNPAAVFNQNPNGVWRKLQEQYGIQFAVCPPKNSMHGKQPFQTLPKTKPEKLADAELRISYLFKNRSKPSSNRAHNRVYSSSREPSKATKLVDINKVVDVSKAIDVRKVIDVSEGVKTVALTPKRMSFAAMKEKYELRDFWMSTTDYDVSEEHDVPLIYAGDPYFNYLTSDVKKDQRHSSI